MYHSSSMMKWKFYGKIYWTLKPIIIFTLSGLHDTMDQDRALTAPLVVFSSRPNSHPFQERHISIQDPIKIGRSVARAHPAPTNAIFDCKVLSRNHALLWFEDNKVCQALNTILVLRWDVILHAVTLMCIFISLWLFHLLSLVLPPRYQEQQWNVCQQSTAQ